MAYNNYNNGGSRQGYNNNGNNGNNGQQRSKSIGGIWVYTSKQGKEYFSISINGVKYLAFANSFKQPGSNQPDFTIIEQDQNNNNSAGTVRNNNAGNGYSNNEVAKKQYAYNNSYNNGGAVKTYGNATYGANKNVGYQQNVNQEDAKEVYYNSFNGSEFESTNVIEDLPTGGSNNGMPLL